jgi:hypothetical protein
VGIQEPSDKGFPRDNNRHKLAEHIANNSEKDGGDNNSLWFEVVDRGKRAAKRG